MKKAWACSQACEFSNGRHRLLVDNLRATRFGLPEGFAAIMRMWQSPTVSTSLHNHPDGWISPKTCLCQVDFPIVSDTS